MRGKPLSETHPELAAQAVGWDPSQFSAGSNKKNLWKCLNGHEFEATLNNRTNGKGCPFCANQKILRGYNDLATTNPDLATEANGWDPTTIFGGTQKKMSWRCVQGHIWDARPADRNNGDGCPYCSGRKALAGYNDLATTHPEIAAQAYGWDPTTVTHGSERKELWKCPLGHEYKAVIYHRCGVGSGCPYCSGREVLAGYNDLATTHPEIAAQAVGWDPTTVTAFANKKRKFKCELGHELDALVANRSYGFGCPYCSGHKLLVGYNDLATTHPEIAAQAVGWDPTTVSRGSGARKKWQCDLGHQWTVPVLSRSSGRDCPYCSGNKIMIGFNDLVTTHPEIAAQAVGWDPTTVSRGSGSRKKWQCDLEHQWVATVTDRVHGYGCPYCSGQAVLAGFNDLVSTHPEIAAQAVGWDPTTVSRGSGKKKKWQCDFEHQWVATVTDRVHGYGCPYCSTSGFNFGKDGWLYFLKHELWGLYQIGISNVPDNRLATHAASGWEVIDLRGPMPGDITYQWEQSILNTLKLRGVSLSPEHIAGRFSGYTESWVQEDFPAKSLNELMNLVHKNEG